MDFNPKYDDVYKRGITPGIEEVGFSCIRADEILNTGDILGQVLSEIQNSTIIVADLTGDNVNVAYEIGYAHHVGTKTILISQTLDKIPFDFRNQRILQYSHTKQGLKDLSKKLANILELETTSNSALLKKLIVPYCINCDEEKYVIAASPLTFQEKKFRQSYFKLCDAESYSEYLGITGLLQALGIIFELRVSPFLINTRDFDEDSMFEPQFNIFSLGSPKANRWTQRILEEIANKWLPTWKFEVDHKSTDLRDPWVNLLKDGNHYEPENIKAKDRTNIDFGLIVRAPHPVHTKQNIMVLAGRTGLGTAASSVVATTPKCISSLIDDWGIELEGNKPFWAIVSARPKSKRNQVKHQRANIIDRDSIEIIDAGKMKPK
jgi:hypothetical protein